MYRVHRATSVLLYVSLLMWGRPLFSQTGRVAISSSGPSADETVNYFNERVRPYRKCNRDTAFAIASNRTDITFYRCDGHTETIPILQLNTGPIRDVPIEIPDWFPGNSYVGQIKATCNSNGGGICGWDEGRTGDFATTDGGVSFLFICKPKTFCIAETNGEKTKQVYYLLFEITAPDSDLTLRIRKAIAHLVDSLTQESKQKVTDDPFAR